MLSSSRYLASSADHDEAERDGPRLVQQHLAGVAVDDGGMRVELHGVCPAPSLMFS